MDRRDFLRRGVGIAAAATTLAACSSRSGSGSTTSSRPVGSTTSPTTSSPPPTSSSTTTTVAHPNTADWQALSKAIHGPLVLPGNPSYATDALLYDPVFNGSHPQAIAYCTSPADVAACIAFAREHGVPFAARAGGHSYGAYSTSQGLVVDVTMMSSVNVDAASRQAVVGAGARLIDVYSACANAGAAIPGGSCPTVGIAGLSMGGGVGVIGRKFGLTCDNILSADVVLADGSKVTADATTNPDLYWALRGGGGGNFGVVTSFTFAAHPGVGELGLFTLVYDWSVAQDVVAAWLRFAPNAPDELWSNCLLLASQHTPSGYGPVARVTGVYVGSESALSNDLQPFLDSVGAQPFDRFVGSAGYMQGMLIEAGCDGDTVPECHLPSENPAGILTRAPFGAKSDYLSSLLSSAGIRTLLAAVEARQASPVLSGGGVALDASGGAINRVAPGATAFVHRSDLATVQYSANWQTGASQQVVSANSSWLESTWRSMRPYVSGQAYQNYIDPALPNWQQAYYGTNLARLREVKSRYDPDNAFRFAQSIPPA